VHDLALPLFGYGCNSNIHAFSTANRLAVELQNYYPPRHQLFEREAFFASNSPEFCRVKGDYFPMPEPQEHQTDEHSEKYFGFQIKGWTNFDPMDKSLAKIAENIEQGGGLLTLVEVLRTENDLARIGDEEVRECFANILAAKRLVKNLHELPQNLLEELRSALKTEEGVAPKKTATRVEPPSANDDARVPRWP